MKTVAELEKENAELRARCELNERMISRLLSEPVKVEVRTVDRVVPGVCLLPHYLCTLPHYPPAQVGYPWVNPPQYQWIICTNGANYMQANQALPVNGTITINGGMAAQQNFGLLGNGFNIQ
jgi:hypothetical protein